ncbi:MAG: hypothetical protein HY046_06460 [Acidobacteria bacterium]|nr:hypothetical protein [Acidobacteriota bacterium]
MKITRTIFGLFSLAAVIAVMPTPAAAQTYAITGAKIWTMAGAPIEGGTVVIKDGKIMAVGKGISVPSGAKVIDGKGLEVYPGFFDSVSEMGLIEIGQGASGTVDNREVGDFNPQLVAATSFHVESEHIPVARAAGVTTVVSAPGQGGGFGGGGTVIGGQASILDLNGWAAAEMTEKRSAALVLNWPTVNTGTFDITTFSFRRRPFTEVKQEYDRRVAELGDLLESARHYAHDSRRRPQGIPREGPAEAEKYSRHPAHSAGAAR